MHEQVVMQHNLAIHSPLTQWAVDLSRWRALVFKLESRNDFVTAFCAFDLLEFINKVPWVDLLDFGFLLF